VDELSLTVEPGNIYGILGPNGSGKTTTLGIILDIIRADGGSYRWFDGMPGPQARRRLGALLETPNFYPYLNADENLAIVAHIKRVKNPNFDQLLDMVNLRKRRRSSFSTYSLGMKQRLAIAGAMIGDPDVLIFDEPTNGLDPQGIAEVRETIRKIGENGKTILMASHILDEVEKVCSHVAIIKSGKLLATGTVGAILDNKLEGQAGCDDLGRLKRLMAELPFISQVKEDGPWLSFQMEPGHDPADLNRLAFENGLTLTHLVARRRSLEAEFLEITKDQ
jgi:ABC-2 type transport system ATP-binding protein